LSPLSADATMALLRRGGGRRFCTWTSWGAPGPRAWAGPGSVPATAWRFRPGRGPEPRSAPAEAGPARPSQGLGATGGPRAFAPFSNLRRGRRLPPASLVHGQNIAGRHRPAAAAWNRRHPTAACSYTGSFASAFAPQRLSWVFPGRTLGNDPPPGRLRPPPTRPDTSFGPQPPEPLQRHHAGQPLQPRQRPGPPPIMGNSYYAPAPGCACVVAGGPTNVAVHRRPGRPWRSSPRPATASATAPAVCMVRAGRPATPPGQSPTGTPGAGRGTLGRRPGVDRDHRHRGDYFSSPWTAAGQARPATFRGRGAVAPDGGAAMCCTPRLQLLERGRQPAGRTPTPPARLGQSLAAANLAPGHLLPAGQGANGQDGGRRAVTRSAGWLAPISTGPWPGAYIYYNG